MSKESSSKEATTCVCGGTFAFVAQHWPHCAFNPVNMSTKTSGAGDALLKTLQTKFSKSELEQISRHGPVKDQPIAAKRKGKSNSKRTKRSIA